MDISNLSIRQKQIFQLLLNSKEFIPSQEIASKLNVSIRTIKSDMTTIKHSIKNSKSSCIFESSPSKGYKIKCEDIEELGDYYLTDNYFFSVNKYFEDDYRQFKIFLDILNSEESLSIQYLTEKYYISRAALYRDIDIISNGLKDYDVQLIYEPYHGVRINGSEIDVRFALQKTLLMNISLIENDSEYYFGRMRFSKNNLLDFINSLSINKISDFELSNLYHHLLSILMRCKINKYIPSESLNYKAFVNEFEIQKTYEYFYKNKPESLTIPRNEIIYFVLLMKGCNLGFCNQMALDLTVQSLDKLSQQLQIELNEYFRINDLSTYLYSLLIRNYNHFIQNAVLLDDIKEKHSLSFDISYHYVKILEDMLNIKIANSEISYLSYFFLDIRESLKKYYIPNKILLVSFRGTNMCRNLLNELSSNFSFYRFEVCELYELKKKVLEENYSFIITDVAVHIDKDIPIILIDYFLDSNDYKLIRKHLRIILSDLIDNYLNNMKRISIDNKTDFIKYISTSTSEYNSLVNREKRMTYQIENTVIIYVYNNIFKTQIFYSKKGINWNSKKVNYLFVINVIENNHLLNYSKVNNMFLKKIEMKM